MAPRKTDRKNVLMQVATRLAIRCAAVVMVSAAAPAIAQDYPVKEITAVCPFAAGTGADITVRYFSSKLSEVLGKPVIVLNKAGATCNIASETVAKAKPDGYTISITPASSTMAAAPHLYKKLPFDPVKDFTPVTTLASLPFVLIVDNKGVAYRNIADSVNDMINGHTDFTFTDATWVVEQAKAGRIRALAVTSSKRSSVLPDTGRSGVPRHRAHSVVGRVPAGGRAAARCRQARRVFRPHPSDAGDHGFSHPLCQRADAGNAGDTARAAGARDHALGRAGGAGQDRAAVALIVTAARRG